MIIDNAGRLPPEDPATIELTYTHRQRLADIPGQVAEIWNISADIEPHHDAGPFSHVGDFEVTIIDFTETNNPQTALAPGCANDSPIPELLLNTTGTALHPQLDQHLQPHGNRILILNSAELGPSWRGFGLGVLLAGTAIKHLSAAARAAVCYPMPHLDHTDGDHLDSQVAVACMTQVWEQLGFEHVHSGLHALDLNHDTLDHVLHDLRARAELAPEHPLQRDGDHQHQDLKTRHARQHGPDATQPAPRPRSATPTT